MSDTSDLSDKEETSYGERDEDFNVDEYKDDIESDESFNELMNDDNTGGNIEEEQADSAEETQNVHNHDFMGCILPGGHCFNKKLVCIKYPGNVINEGKAIDTLGGISEISATANARNRRMELRFRPDDGYCKPACGDRHQTAGFLLRIRIKKSLREKAEKEELLPEKQNSSHNQKNKSAKKNTEDESVNKLSDGITNCSIDSQSSTQNDQPFVSDKNQPPTFDREAYENLSEDVKYELPKLKVLGRVDTEFRFTNLCDFQYLPITKNRENPSKDECIYDSIYPVGLPPYSWLKGEVPYFLPPAAFSRMDNVQQYAPKTEVLNSGVQYVIGKTRKRRAGFSNFISFNTPYVPMNPPKGIETAMRVKFIQSSHVEQMRKAFEDRPIWSKTALMFVTKFTNEQLKILLPSVAYYFMTGPWRITWVRLGYDPRKDPTAKKYQTLDYRLKAMHGLHSNITCKRNYAEYTLPYRNTPISKAKTMVLTPNANKIPIQKKQKMTNENVYIYRPGIIPPSRQMFYQYCDLHVKEIQDMLDKCVGPPPGTPCHEKLGWLPVGFDDLCREIINKQVRIELRKMMNIPENHPTALPRKRKFELTAKSLIRAEKRRKQRLEKKKALAELAQLAEQRPPAVVIYDENEPMDECEWEDVLEEAPDSTNENDTGDKS